MAKSALHVHARLWRTEMTPRSKTNLIAAMKCDALDAAKYRRFAARARMEADWELADAFQDTAERDRTEHFCKEAELAGVISNSARSAREVSN
jgi:rubrerythrin